jgi:hypothetical protein
MEEQQGTARGFSGKNAEIHPVVFHKRGAEGENPSDTIFQPLILIGGKSINRSHI